MKTNTKGTSIAKACLVVAAVLSTGVWQNAWAQNRINSPKPDHGVLMGAIPGYGAATNNVAPSPAATTTVNAISCSGGRSWTGSSCVCSSGGSWDGMVCQVPVPAPAPAPIVSGCVNAGELWWSSVWTGSYVTCVASNGDVYAKNTQSGIMFFCNLDNPSKSCSTTTDQTSWSYHSFTLNGNILTHANNGAFGLLASSATLN